MKFSVLMSVYKKEDSESFDLALSSILEEQTLMPNEFVLVCDGPLTKDLDNVIEKYQQKFPDILKVKRLEENLGLGKALNHGLRLCKYDYIARADSDDICKSRRFEKQINFLKSNPKVSAVGTDIIEFEKFPTIIKAYKQMPRENNDIKMMAKMRNPLNHMTVMFRKKDIESVGSYQHLAYVEDYYLWIRLLAEGYLLANINEALVYARVGNGMIQRRTNKEYIKSWNVLSKYMLRKKMISIAIYLVNFIAIRLFVYTPKEVKELIYKKVLRGGKYE